MATKVKTEYTDGSKNLMRLCGDYSIRPDAGDGKVFPARTKFGALPLLTPFQFSSSTFSPPADLYLKTSKDEATLCLDAQGKVAYLKNRVFKIKAGRLVFPKIATVTFEYALVASAKELKDQAKQAKELDRAVKAQKAEEKKEAKRIACEEKKAKADAKRARSAAKRPKNEKKLVEAEVKANKAKNKYAKVKVPKGKPSPRADMSGGYGLI